MTKHFFAMMALGLALSFQNCSKVQFSSMQNSSDSINTDTGGPNCHEVLNTIATPIKMIFVIDVSGSNSDTDPDMSVRAGSISRFYNEFSAKTNFAWNAISFAGTTATVRLAEGDGQTEQDLMDWFNNHTDDGNTPYVAALDKTADMITNDTHQTADAKYVVVFLSDGKPNPDVDDNTLKTEVQKVVNTLPADRVSFNTVYYGPTDADASGRLKMMAQAGGGNFLDTNSNSSGNLFSIADLVIVPGEVCQ